MRKCRQYVRYLAPVAVLGALASSASAQTSTFDIATFVQDVDVAGQLTLAVSSLSQVLLVVAGIMCAIAVVWACVMWARRSFK